MHMPMCTLILELFLVKPEYKSCGTQDRVKQRNYIEMTGGNHFKFE